MLIPFLLLLWPPTGPQPLTPERINAAKAKLGELKAEAKAIVADMQEGKQRSFTISVTEDEINALVQGDNRASEMLVEANITRPEMNVSEGRVRAIIGMNRFGLPLRLSVDLQPVVTAEQKLSFKVAGAGLGHMGIPTGWVEPYVRKAGDDLIQRMSATTFRFTTFDVRQNEVHMEGVTR